MTNEFFNILLGTDASPAHAANTSASLLEVTIRTPQGGSYIITLDPYTAPGTSIKVGDPWGP